MSRPAEHPLCHLFLEALGKATEAPRPGPGLESRLAELVAQGREAFPQLQLDPARFLRRVARSVAEEKEGAAVLEALHAADLYLACACAEGVLGAAEQLESRFFGALPRAVARMADSPSFGDEVQQELRERLLLPRRSGAPGIASYSGRGPLAAWLRISAKRTALNLLEQRRPAAQRDRELDERVLVASRGGRDLELQLIKADVRPAFDRALREALAALGPRERLLLRLHYVDGLSTRQIGTTLQLHQSSVSRAVAAARKSLRDRTLQSLGAQLQLPEAALQSLAGLVASQLELSLSGLLSR